MKTIRFLSMDEVLQIQVDQIQRYGGSLGVRDRDLLSSAIAMAEAGFGGEYLHSNLFEMAAAYLFHIVQNHPFVDGNKRVGTMAAFTFLKLNGHTLRVDDADFESLVLSVAEGKAGKAAIAEFFRNNIPT